MISKIAICTEALGGIQSGGIRCIIYFLNLLKDRGHEVCAFVNHPPYDSTWLPSKFPVYSTTSNEYQNFDGILVSPYSPTAKLVAEHSRARRKIYWVHTFEGAFKHNGPKWMKMAIDSYRLKNIEYVATSHYVKTILELIFEQKVMPHLVPGGIDPKVFFFDHQLYKNKMKNFDKQKIFCMLNRPEPLRGIDIAKQAFNELKKEGEEFELKMFAGLPQNEMYKAYGSAHFFVDPSLLAGLPLPPLEAASCGTIPICTHFGTSDYIINDENGFFINANDIIHIKSTIKRCNHLTQHEYNCLSENARKMTHRWTWDNMVDSFISNLQI